VYDRRLRRSPTHRPRSQVDYKHAIDEDIEARFPAAAREREPMNGALAYGPLMALDDRARPGKEPTITPEAKA
jgi:hypothetical protein